MSFVIMIPNEKTAEALEILDSQIRAVATIIDVLKFQILSNADQLESLTKEIADIINDFSDQKSLEYRNAVQQLIKIPIRRQVGILQGVLVSLKHSREKIKD